MFFGRRDFIAAVLLGLASLVRRTGEPKPEIHGELPPHKVELVKLPPDPLPGYCRITFPGISHEVGILACAPEFHTPPGGPTGLVEVHFATMMAPSPVMKAFYDRFSNFTDAWLQNDGGGVRLDWRDADHAKHTVMLDRAVISYIGRSTTAIDMTVNDKTIIVARVVVRTTVSPTTEEVS